jgi:hypothetical protein
MPKIKRCSYCDVPKELSKGNRWNNDGTITQADNPDRKQCFLEADNLDNIFHRIEDLLGVPLERIVIEGRRRPVMEFLRANFSSFKRAIIRTFFRRRVYETIADIGTAFGLGHYELLDCKRGDYIKVYGRNIYCLPMMCGDLVGVFNFVEGLPADLSIEEKDGGHIITVVKGEEFEEEISSRLTPMDLPRKPGNIQFDCCPECGVPLDFKKFTWELEEGVIIDNVTGRHMITAGPSEINSVFRELEAELGEDIPRTIVESQRRYILETLQDTEVKQDSEYLRHQLAMRGMGNLVELDLGDNRMEAVVENVGLPLLVVGTLQGIFELINGGESDCEYKRSEDGTLGVTVSAR